MKVVEKSTKMLYKLKRNSKKSPEKKGQFLNQEASNLVAE